MKSYTITVNGNVYDVTVEENGSAVLGGSSTETCSCNSQLQHQQHRQLLQQGRRKH